MPRASLYAILFVVGLVGYGGLAWDRLGHQSAAPHFVLQADAWLHGRTTIDHPVGDDWARVETVALTDGTEASGRRLASRKVFRTLAGDELPMTAVKQTVRKTTYVSFPPLPTLLMLPSALLSGEQGNDVFPAVLVAAAILPLALLVLRTLVAHGLSRRTLRDDLWLVATLAFGSVLWFSAVQGSVWFCAHVCGVALALVYAWAAIGARRPVVAGIALGAAALTRTPMAFMFPLFALEALRVANESGTWRAAVKPLAKFAAPVVAFAVAGMAYNAARFGTPTEFGHTYLEVRQQAQIEQYGLFSVHYLARNLAVGFTLLPEWLGHAPWVAISGHGLAMWFTTPLLVYVLWPREQSLLHRTLWITVACVALPSLMYQNSGWIQFGYRFGLDYLVFLIMLVAVGGRRIGRVGMALIGFGIVVNLFGAATFDHGWKYYRLGGDAYDVIVRH